MSRPFLLRLCAIALAAATGLALTSSAAPAQNLLESLFGGQRATPAPAPPADAPGRGLCDTVMDECRGVPAGENQRQSPGLN